MKVTSICEYLAKKCRVFNCGIKIAHIKECWLTPAYAILASSIRELRVIGPEDTFNRRLIERLYLYIVVFNPSPCFPCTRTDLQALICELTLAGS